MSARRVGGLLGVMALMTGTPALGQLLGAPLPSQIGALPHMQLPLERPLARTPPRVRDQAESALAPAAGVAGAALSEVRRLTVERLLRDHPQMVEADDEGRPVVRGEVLALSPAAATLARLEAAGFRIARRSELDGLGLQAVVLRPPAGVSAREAMQRVRALDPEGAYEFNHLYQLSGQAGTAAPQRPARAPPAPVVRGVRLGLVDASAAANHPSLRRSRVTQRTFAPGGARATDHATAVASLMVGQAAPFRGAAPGADLYVADVYGTTPAGGSAEAIARGMAWLAQNRVAVVNVSLVGPRNRLLEQAVAALHARGVAVVAAVGNDGPAAPPLYPAAYPGVVGVTAVNGRRQALPEAGRGSHVDFAAPGADMVGAGAAGGFLTVRGTSFAAPLVAGLIGRHHARVEGLAAEDLGAPGPDPVFGRGLVGFALRTEPGRVGVRTRAGRSP